MNCPLRFLVIITCSSYILARPRLESWTMHENKFDIYFVRNDCSSLVSNVKNNESSFGFYISLRKIILYPNNDYCVVIFEIFSSIFEI